MKDDGGRRVEILRKLEDNVAPTFAMHGEMPGGGALQICVCLKTPSPTFREICCYEFNLMDDLLERNAIKVKIHEPSHQISANHTKRQHQVIMIFSHGNGSPARSCKGLRLSIWLWSDIARNGCSWQRQTSSWLHIQQLVWRQKGTTFQSMNLALCWRLVAISKMLSSKSHYFLLSLSCYVDKNSSVENWRCHHISLESTPKLGKQDETFQDMTIQKQSEICYLLSKCSSVSSSWQSLRMQSWRIAEQQHCRHELNTFTHRTWLKSSNPKCISFIHLDSICFNNILDESPLKLHHCGDFQNWLPLQSKERHRRSAIACCRGKGCTYIMQLYIYIYMWIYVYIYTYLWWK